jgi:hypothetical protein
VFKRGSLNEPPTDFEKLIKRALKIKELKDYFKKSPFK